jgi:glycine betaine/proline transport system permease protein
VLVAGVIGLVAVRLLLGGLANGLLERRFRVWRIEDDEKHAGPDFSLASGAAALVLTLLVIPIAALRFGGYGTAFLTSMPVDQSWHTHAAIWLDGVISSFGQSIRPLALGVTRGLDWVLGLLEAGLTQTPWPIVGAIILALAWQLAGVRVAIFTFVALAYLALLGFWEKSLQTIALLGTAALISIAIGIPLGVLSGYNRRFAAFLRPVLDFLQTMPAFVYLIPVIALFGIGKPSGIIATVIFGVPPVVRLTALGIARVPANVREATQSLGASAFFTLRKADLPLAMHLDPRRHQPEHPDVPVDGGDRLADRRAGAGRGRAALPAIPIAETGAARRLCHPRLRHHPRSPRTGQGAVAPRFNKW